MGTARQISPVSLPGLASQPGRAFVAPHTRARLRIYPVADLSPFKRSRSSRMIVLDWTEDSDAALVSIQWSKQMGQSAGSWSATVKPKHTETGELLELTNQAVLDGDWIDLSVLRNGIEIPVMRGVVDSVREARSSVGGATSITYTLTGRDHGAFFEYPITWSSLWSRTLGELARGLFTDRVQGSVGGRPDELFSILITAAFDSNPSEAAAGNPAGQWVLPTSLASKQVGERLIDALNVITFDAVPGTKGLRGGYYNQPGLWTVGEQDLHSLLTQWANPMLNEFWYDLAMPAAFTPPNGLSRFLSVKNERFASRLGGQSPTADVEPFGTMAAFCRERPFPTTDLGLDSMWFALPTWRLPTWTLLQTDLGRAGHDRFNLFELLAEVGLGPKTNQAAYGKPVWRPRDIEVRGLRALQESTKYVAEGKGGEADWQAERRIWQRILRDWNAPNPYLRQGTVVTKLLAPEIRIGQRLILDGGDHGHQEQFYVEGVAGTWRSATSGAGESSTTTFTVTRGFSGTDAELVDVTEGLAELYKEAF